MSQPKLFSMIDKAVFEYNLIENGDKILIGASGGKDSTALVEYFVCRKKQNREQFDFTALHIASDFSEPLDYRLVKLFNSWQVEPKVIQVDILGRLKEGKKMNCYWCSTQRRSELNNYAIEHGYNKIALGHHMDDILETLLMNVLSKGQMSTMIPRLKYEKYPVTVIRPLCFADENSIIEHANNSGYISVTCTCDYQNNSYRKKARSRLDSLTAGSSAEKRKLFESLRNIKTDYLP
ncbi:MAG: tRNA 2-thiocytidine biosynthesis TtcA family protein [Treponemataceae bacterium]